MAAMHALWMKNDENEQAGRQEIRRYVRRTVDVTYVLYMYVHQSCRFAQLVSISAIESSHIMGFICHFLWHVPYPHRAY